MLKLTSSAGAVADDPANPLLAERVDRVAQHRRNPRRFEREIHPSRRSPNLFDNIPLSRINNEVGAQRACELQPVGHDVGRTTGSAAIDVAPSRRRDGLTCRMR